MKLLISGFSRSLRNGKQNAKNYPYWNELLTILEGAGVHTTQLGITGERKLNTTDAYPDLAYSDLEILVKQYDGWIAVDNFFPHFAHYHNRPGIVLWGKSDPNIFGYPENINIIKDRRYLRQYQFSMWEDEEYDATAFLDAVQTFSLIKDKYKLTSTLSLTLEQYNF